MTAAKPRPATRLAIIGVLVLVAACSHNPLVKFEAMFGLSPAPFERFTGLHTVFSGMTAASYDMAHLDLMGAIRSNVLSPLMAAAAIGGIATWRFPKATPSREPLLLGAAVAGSVIVEIGWRLLH